MPRTEYGRESDREWLVTDTRFLLRETEMFQGFSNGSVVKNLPVKQEPRVWLLGREEPLEEGMVTHSSILAWRIPGKEHPGGLQSIGLPRVGHD